MKLTLANVSVTIGVLLGIGGLATGLGYGWPWWTAAAGADLKRIERGHYNELKQAIISQGKQELIDATSNRIAALNTQKTIIMLGMMHEKKDSQAYILLENQLDDINRQLRSAGALP